MTFEETFKNWTLEQKAEWALGPNICNLSENMRSIIVDLKAENEQLKHELKQTEAQDQVVVKELRNALWMARAMRAKAKAKECCAEWAFAHRDYDKKLEKYWDDKMNKWLWAERKCREKAKEFE